MFASSENEVLSYMGSSSIRFDLSISFESIFGPERDRYCRHMLKKAVLCGENIDPWQMWQRVSPNAVVCKYCRLSTGSEYMKHGCGRWERARGISGLICFCFCHDDLGYALDNGDQFVICNFGAGLGGHLERSLRDSNALHIDYIHGTPLSRIKYVASRDGRAIFSDDDTGMLRPSDILSIQAFSGFKRRDKTFAEKVQILRSTALGQFLTMLSMRRFQRCSKSLWRLRGDKQFLMIKDLMIIDKRIAVSASKAMAGASRDIPLRSLEGDAMCL
jgi:hypothetical protein